MIEDIIKGLQELFDDLEVCKGHERSIRIIDSVVDYSDESSTYIWIRLEGAKMEYINFSNVILADSKRNKG